MWNKKAICYLNFNPIKMAISVVIGSAIICGGVIYRINDNEMYVETGESFILEIEDREQFEDITYQEKIDYLMMSLNEKTIDDGLKDVNFERPSGRVEELSLKKNTRKFNLFREGMIDGMISETDKHIVNGMAMMFEDDGDESEFYESFKEKSIEKYNDRYIEIMTEYKNVLLEVEKDFEDNKLKYTYTKEFEEIDEKYENFLEDFATFMASYMWSNMWDYIWDYQ